MNKLLQDFDRKVTYPIGKVNGVVGVTYDDEDFDSSESDDDNMVYEQKFVEEERKKYAKNASMHRSGMDDVSSCAGFLEVDGLESLVDRKNNPYDIYRNYNFRCNTDIKKELPIDSCKEKILTSIDINQVVVIEGPTGCGKTTQVSQYILDEFRERGQYCNIAVTQPRRIATINVAKRVCEERGWTLGTVCGYQVGLEKKTSPDMLITYMTTGVLLQKIIRAKTLREYTHIIIDEIHERNQELEFLLLVVRKFLFTNSLQTKVILMSATINADEFAHYYRSQTAAEIINAPVIRIVKKSKYNKTLFYLDSCYHFANPIPKADIDKPEISPEVWKVFIFLVKIFDKLDEDDTEKGTKRIGSVLVFLPGINEIEEADKLLNSQVREKFDDKGKPLNLPKWEIVPLHSSLPSDEQAKAFMSQKPGYRKIILSTNIAESSVTVPDSCYVIDFCLTKVMTVDPVTKYMSLKLEWASHVNCDQRAGRVGRTNDGRVYRLVLKKFYMEEMSKQSVPEILRAPLERIVLQAKMLNLNETPAQILALSLNPPNLKNIASTIWHLKEVGALLKTCRGILSNSDGDITFLGQVMASLPIEVHLSKLIVLGQMYSLLEEAIIIAAGCSIQNVFSVPFQRRLDAYKKLLLWSDGSQSDLIALLNLYQVWQTRKRENTFDNIRSEMQWCQMNLVSLKGLKEWNLLINEIKARLERLNIKETFGPTKVKLESAEKPTVLKVITAGAFYPNYYIKVPETGQGQSKEREAVKILGGRDPFSCVYFTGMDHNQPVQVYVRPIKRLLKDNSENETDIQIGFDCSSKVYVEFKNCNRRDPISVNVDGFQMLTTIPGKIPTQVYEAIRKRQLRYPFSLKVLPAEEAWKFAERYGISRSAPMRRITYGETNCFSSVEYSPIPSLDTEYIRLVITNLIDAGHFWAQNCSPENDELLQQIDETLNKQVLHPVTEPIKVGKYYAAKFNEDNLFYRCKVTASGGKILQITFIDYGNIQQVGPNDLYQLPTKPHCQVAPLAIECVMCNIKPCIKKNPRLVWTDEVNEYFGKLTQGVALYGKVYSVVNDVLHLELYRHENNQDSINNKMVKLGYAEACEESFLSKQNHEQRLQVQQSENPNSEANKFSFEKIVSYADFRTPEIGKTYDTIELRGPFSPLEMKVSSCVDGGSSKIVDVEGTSVNAVLLDSEPDSEHSRLVVAAYVGQSSEGSRLKLRQTTVMPSIPGFPMLLSLLFCPTMEPKLSPDCSEVSAILCGLGYNEFTNKPLFPPHDMLLTLDTELTAEEIEKVNKLRYLMNTGLKLMYEVSRNMSSQDELLQTQFNIKTILFDLISMRRKPVKRHEVETHGSGWGRGLECAVILKPNMEDNPEDIWSLLWFVKLKATQNDTVRTNLEDMSNMIYNVTPFQNINCELCNFESFTIYDLRFHLISDEHKEKVRKYYEQLQNFDDE